MVFERRKNVDHGTASSRRLSGEVKRAYMLALLVLAVLVACSFAVTREITLTGERGVEALDRALGQSAAAVSINEMFTELQQAPEDERKIRALGSASRAMLARHLTLRHEARRDTALHALYFAGPHHLDARITEFADLAGQIARAPLLLQDPALRRVLEEAATVSLPSLLEQSARLHGLATREELSALWRWAVALVGVTISALVLEGALILQPLTNRILRQNSALSRASASLERAARYDDLTGLPNRRGLVEALQKMIDVEPDKPPSIGVLQIGLDHFNAINSALGHAGGDAVLREVARRLRRVAPADALVARIGGDEFVVGLRLPRDGDALTPLSEEIHAALRQVFRDATGDCRLTASIGVARTEDSVDEMGRVDGGRLLSDADIALFRAKQRGRDRTQTLTRAIRDKTIERQRIGGEIREALERNEYIAYLQPQMSAGSHELVGFEALARWRHRQRGVLAPGAFMDVAEDLNLVDKIDAQVLRHACATLRAWREEGMTPPRVSVNLSARRLAQPGLVSEITAVLETNGLSPAAIGIEVLESVMLEQQNDEVTWNLAALADLGFEIELDDFGTGHASLSNLQKLRPNRVKIDRSFITNIETDAERRDLVALMVDIADRVGARSLAEGVETIGQAEILREIGCEALQGFYFSRPAPPELARDWLEAGMRPQKVCGTSNVH